MARPKKETVDYFPHDANASDGVTLTIIQSKFGNDGYAFWFRLLEILASTKGHVFNCRNTVRWQFLQAKTHLQEDTVCSLLDLLSDLDAIDSALWKEKKLIWCDNLVNNVADVYRNRRMDVPEKPISTDDNTTADVVSNTKSTQTKLNKTKLNNIQTDFETFWKEYPKKKSKGDAEKAFSKLDIKNGLVDKILAALIVAKKSDSWVKDNGQFIPYPATWLNRRGWEDEFTDGDFNGKDKSGRLPTKYTDPDDLRIDF